MITMRLGANYNCACVAVIADEIIRFNHAIAIMQYLFIFFLKRSKLTVQCVKILSARNAQSLVSNS